MFKLYYLPMLLLPGQILTWCSPFVQCVSIRPVLRPFPRKIAPEALTPCTTLLLLGTPAA